MAKDIWVNIYSDIDGQVQFTFGGDTISTVEGKGQTVMHWLKVLVTEPGSNIFDKNYGTVFSQLLGANFGDTVVAREIGAAGFTQATELVQRAQKSQNLSEEEKLSGHELIRFRQESQTSVSFVVTLYNARNETMTVGIRTGS